jgi:phage shock protein PspC (stress-responsive transcriptional regulator)
MGQGFGDEIGKALIRFMVLVFVVGGSVAVALYLVVGWIAHHLAVSWR